MIDDDRIALLERQTHDLADRVARLERAPRPARAAERRPAEPRRRAEPRPLAAGEPAEAAAAPVGERAETARARRPRLDAARLEALVGGRLIAWLGGGAVVLGLALLAGIAASHGWIGPTARTGIVAAAAVALAFAGLRTTHAVLARALLAAGIASGFVTTCLAAPVYGLVPGPVAALAAIGVGAVGTALALRRHSPGIAALGILGGLAAPLVAGGTDAATIPLVLIASASAAAVLVWQRWDWLRAGLVVLALPQLALGVLDPAHPGHSPAGSLVALGVLALILGVAAVGYELRVRRARPAPASALVLLAGAAGVATIGWLACVGSGHETLGHLWIAGLAAAHLAAGLGLRRAPAHRDTGVLVLAVGVALADVAAASMADGLLLGLLWSASAAGAALLVRRARTSEDRLLAATGLAGQLVLAIAHALVSVPPQQLVDGTAGPGIAGLAAATVAAALGAFAARTAATVADRPAPCPRRREHLLRGAALALEAVALVMLAYLTATLTGGAALVVALALHALARHDRGASTVVRHGAPAFLTVATIAALLTVVPPDALADGFDDPLGAAVALAALGLTAARLAHRATGPLRILLTAGAALAPLQLASGLLVTAIPSDQAGQVAVSVLWALTGLAALVAGLRLGRRAVRMAGLGLLLVAAGKVFLLDLATLTSVYRVASFVGLGLLLLAAALAWQRDARRHGLAPAR